LRNFNCNARFLYFDHSPLPKSNTSSSRNWTSLTVNYLEELPVMISSYIRWTAQILSCVLSIHFITEKSLTTREEIIVSRMKVMNNLCETLSVTQCMRESC
jgi:hypothetical protein